MRTRPIGTGDQRPRGIYQNRERECPQCESDVHRIACEAIETVRNDARTRIERNGIGAGAFLRNESADIQCDSGEKEKRANYPIETCRARSWFERTIQSQATRESG